ncbi:antitoxin Xre/MbcA/ParS toxin-binding domain-containing protein [Pseudomonas lini]
MIRPSYQFLALWPRNRTGCWSQGYERYLLRRGDILALAVEVLGTQKIAERWIDQPAFGLARRTPSSFLNTPAGVCLVRDFLFRLEYGVYC